MVAGRDKAVHPETKRDSNHQTTPAVRLITAKDIRIAVDSNQETIPLAPGGIVTPLAKDQAKEYAIRIVREPLMSE
jgi:hypothetical protein